MKDKCQRELIDDQVLLHERPVLICSSCHNKIPLKEYKLFFFPEVLETRNPKSSSGWFSFWWKLSSWIAYVPSSMSSYSLSLACSCRGAGRSKSTNFCFCFSDTKQIRDPPLLSYLTLLLTCLKAPFPNIATQEIRASKWILEEHKHSVFNSSREKWRGPTGRLWGQNRVRCLSTCAGPGQTSSGGWAIKNRSLSFYPLSTWHKEAWECVMGAANLDEQMLWS